MKKDIPFIPVKDIALAVVHEQNEQGEDGWYVYLLNLKDVEITNIIVSSRGYGLIDNKEVETSTLRHFFEKLGASEPLMVERIMEDVFGLNNEYFLSFYIGTTIYDKQFIFLPESIKEEYFTNIPIINKKGVMIK